MSQSGGGGLDVGAQVVAEVHRRLMIDDEWTRAVEGGFVWVAHRLAQHVEAGSPVESRGLLVTPVRAWTTVVERVTADERQVEQALALLNYVAVGSAYVYWPEQRLVTAHAQHQAHSQTAALRAEELADYAILQLCEAERAVELLAERVGGAPAWRDLPGHGPRSEPDEMLGVVDAYYRPEGAGPTRFVAPAEYRAAAVAIQQAGIELRQTGPHRWRADIVTDTPAGYTLLLAADAEHPRLGRGLGVRLTATMESGDLRQCAALAARVQRQQFSTVQGGGSFGAWAVDVDGLGTRLAWNRFVPNLLYRDGRVRDVVASEVNRAAWVTTLTESAAHPSP